MIHNLTYSAVEQSDGTIKRFTVDCTCGSYSGGIEVHEQHEPAAQLAALTDAAEREHLYPLRPDVTLAAPGFDVRLDGCTCDAVRGAHKPPCQWATHPQRRSAEAS